MSHVSFSNVRGFAALALLSVVAGCTSTPSDGGSTVAGAAGQVAALEGTPVIQGECPQVSLREGTAFYREGGDDPADIEHQASISATTRQCSLSGGEMLINVTVAGRVAAGPAGGPGPVDLPIRVAVLRGEEVIYSEMKAYRVELPSNAPTTQFVYSDPNVRIPADAAGEVRVYAGFDEGPYDTP